MGHPDTGDANASGIKKRRFLIINMELTRKRRKSRVTDRNRS